MNKVKKAYLRFTVLMILAVSTLSGNPDNCGFVTYGESVNGCNAEIPCCESTGHFFVRGDVLYWTPRITGLELDFGTNSIVQEMVDSTQVLTTEEVDLDPHFKWDAGYRVGVGYENKDWEAGALWTHFQGKGKRSTHEDIDILNSGRVKIKLDQIDVAVAYNFSLGSSFNLKPFIGVRGTKIHEHLNAVLLTEISLSPISEVIETNTFDDGQKYRGIGPLFGFQGDWEMGCGFGLYGTVAAGLLYGNYTVHFDDTDTFTLPFSKQFFSHNRRHVHAFDWNIDLALGLCWHTQILNQFELGMKLGFEHHQYFNQNRICVGRGDISFTGGVFSLDLGF
jgi:hypothetical protein